MKGEKNLKFKAGQGGKSGYYVTEITLNYRRVRRFAGHSKEEARAYLGKLRIAAREGRLSELISPQPTGDTFGEYARALLDNAEWKQKRSAARDETSLRALNRKFKNVPLAVIRPNIVRDYMTERIKAGLRPASVNRERSLLVSILSAAVGDGIIESNAIGQKGVKRLEENNSREEKILAMNLDEKKLRELVEKAAAGLRPIIEIALLAGMREGEILSMKWSQVDFDCLKITIPVASSKSKKERSIPIGSDLLNVLSNIERRDEKQPYIFPSGKTHLKTIRRPFIVACDTVGIEYGREKGLIFHDLRHVAASQLVKRIDVMTASRILGHSSIETTMRYVHPTDADKRAAVEALAEWLRGRQKDVNAFEGGSGQGLPVAAASSRLLN